MKKHNLTCYGKIEEKSKKYQSMAEKNNRNAKWRKSIISWKSRNEEKCNREEIREEKATHLYVEEIYENEMKYFWK